MKVEEIMTDWRMHEEAYRGFRITISRDFPTVAVISTNTGELVRSTSAWTTNGAIKKAKQFLDRHSFRPQVSPVANYVRGLYSYSN
jgi:hypothetical protein